MQVLAAPTRQEVDRAHARNRWLDIGVPSVRNLWHISPYRAVVWWILGLSSIPLHLLYNSAFYASIGAADYRIDFVSPDFGEKGGVIVDVLPEVFQGEIPPVGVRSDFRTPDHCVTNATCQTLVLDHLRRLQISDDAVLEKLSAESCIDAYGRALLTDRSNLLIVVSNQTQDGVLQADYSYTLDSAVHMLQSVYKPFEWICSSSDRMKAHLPELAIPLEQRPNCESWLQEVQKRPEVWTPLDHDVDFCLSEVIQQRCSFSGNISILAAVIAFNFVKMLCMLFVAFGLDGSTPLITMGDAVAEFLARPDPTTRDRCLWARRGFSTDTSPSCKPIRPPSPKVAARRQRRWREAASSTRWTWTLLLLGLAIGVVLCLFGAGYAQLKRHSTPISALGFGKIHASALVNGWGIVQMSTPKQQIIAAILVANLPQTILSFLYLNLNGLVTSLWMSAEWLSYSTVRRPLRVSEPTGVQRMTFFLQLPYHISAPLMVLSGILHWLVSQSFFLAVVAEYNWDGTLLNSTAIATCGYSLVPMVAVIATGVGLIIGLVFLGWLRRLDGNTDGLGVMPLAGSCSAAISAACHRPSWDMNAADRSVMWGSTSHDDGQQVGSIGHCCFTSGPVDFVVEGKEYK